MPKYPEKPTRIARKTIYENPWVNLYADHIIFPAGRVIEEHHIIEFERESVGVIVENKHGQLLFVEAYRYPTASIEWEIPAGGIDTGESILDAAAREVVEETGYETTEHELLYTYHPINGISNCTFHLARCHAGSGTGVFDKNEVRSIRWFDRDEIMQMIRKKSLRDGYTLTGVLYHFMKG